MCGEPAVLVVECSVTLIILELVGSECGGVGDCGGGGKGG